MNERALTFQRSGDLLLDARSDPDGKISRQLSQFAQLESAAGNVHRFRVTEISLWAAAATGFAAEQCIEVLERHAVGRIPQDLIVRMSDFFGRYGRIRLEGSPGSLRITSDDRIMLQEAARWLGRDVEEATIPIGDEERGMVKALLAQKGYAIADHAAIVGTETVDYHLLGDVHLRGYQQSAIDQYLQAGSGGGVVLLPCGAGKTVVGVAVAASLSARVLVVTPNRTIGEQWAEHFRQLTSLESSDIALFSGETGDRTVTITTYQALTSSQNGLLPRLRNAADVPWGLVIYDEVHTLPADVFRQSAALQSSRRLGLTATLVREDGREREVFALIGPPVWQSRWRDLEAEGWISPVECYEVRIDNADGRDGEGRGLAAKLRVAERILQRHRQDSVLVAAHRLHEVNALARRLGAPSVTGETSQGERRRLYDAFRQGVEPCLIVSRVANVGVDLPDANVMIQVSGTFGSRLEEAQRLGRLLRPKQEGVSARFYTLVRQSTRERQFAEKRQRFLVDQGYRYNVVNVRA